MSTEGITGQNGTAKGAVTRSTGDDLLVPQADDSFPTNDVRAGKVVWFSSRQA